MFCSKPLISRAHGGQQRLQRVPLTACTLTALGSRHAAFHAVLRKEKERKGKERKGKERKGKERKGKERKEYAFWRHQGEAQCYTGLPRD